MQTARTTGAITDDEAQKLLHELERQRSGPAYLRNYLLALLMLDAGLRVGEATSIRHADLVVFGKVVDVLRVRPDIAKNHRERLVPLTRRLKDAITAFWTEASRSATDEKTLAFPGHRDPAQPITVRMVEKMISDASKRCLGRRIHPHTLRHAFATRLLLVTDLRTVQELLGHNHVSSTQIYTHTSLDRMKQAVDSLPTGRLRY